MIKDAPYHSHNANRHVHHALVFECAAHGETDGPHAGAKTGDS